MATKALHVKSADSTFLRPSDFWTVNPLVPYWFGGELTAAAGAVSVTSYSLGLVPEGGKLVRGRFLLRNTGATTAVAINLKISGTTVWQGVFPLSGTLGGAIAVPGDLGDLTVLPLGGATVNSLHDIVVQVTATNGSAVGLSAYVLIAPAS